VGLIVNRRVFIKTLGKGAAIALLYPLLPQKVSAESTNGLNVVEGRDYLYIKSNEPLHKIKFGPIPPGRPRPGHSYTVEYWNASDWVSVYGGDCPRER
jgi:hypothetical protein